jgi:uncharacterized protein YbjT (DUF2867 family)
MPRSEVITHETLVSNTRKPLLVTGAAGNVGRRVVELLLEVAAGPIIAPRWRRANEASRRRAASRAQ